MTKMKIIGREYEQAVINNYLESGKAELIAVYGRRRVGKTYLVKSIFDNQFDFFYTGLYDVQKIVQLEQFKKQLERYTGQRVKRFKDWFEAFDSLRDYLDSLSKERIVVFLDEIPWMDNPRSEFLAAFGQFWNNWASTKQNLKLFVCGSATTWMLSKIIGDKGGIYGRVCRPIWLAPFNLAETELFLKEIKGIEMTRYQILQTYMVFGGIPYYLDMLVKDMPLSVNIDDLFFRQKAPLRDEFDFLFRSLFNNSRIYKGVVETLSGKLKGMTRLELKEAMHLKDGGDLSEVLENLEKCDFIRKYTAIGKTERDAMYQLTDLFSLFHMKFVEDNNGQDEHLWTKISGKRAMTAWSGYAFEQVCLHHTSQIKKALSIGGIISNIHSWSCRPFTDNNGTEWKGGQIDLLIDRTDDVINICEVKYASGEYVIDADYALRLQSRSELFRQVTRTRKALQHIFITTYGVSKNMYSGMIQAEVKMDELFQ